jgi:hypothetical protein
LIQKVIAQAVLTEDPRLSILRKAHVEAKAEEVLRRMSIICENDIQREFPSK